MKPGALAAAITRLVKKRRLANPRHGFLHSRQAKALEPFVKKAKTVVPLDPGVKPLIESLADSYEKNTKWRLVLNEPVEIDS